MGNMDRTSLNEMILADYIQKVENWSREKLLNALIDLKLSELERLTDAELIQRINEHKIING